MLEKVTPKLLADCLADVSSGRSTIEGCVVAHPAFAEELRSLLEIVSAIEPSPPVTPDPLFRLRGRVALIEAISAKKDPVTRSHLQRFWRKICGG